MKVSVYQQCNPTEKPIGDSSVEHIVKQLKSTGNIVHKNTLHCRTLSGQQYKDFKSTKMMSAMFGGTFSGGKQDTLIEPSGLVHFDEDHLGIEQAKQGVIDKKSNEHVYLAFVSPSGAGVKYAFLVDPVPQNNEQYKDCWRQIADTYGLEDADPQAKNINRHCILAHDPNLYYNPDAKPFKWDTKLAEKEAKQRELDRIDKQIRQLNNSNLEADADLLNYIDPDGIDYEEWLMLITGCKEGGLSVEEVEAWSSSGQKHRTKDVEKRWSGLDTSKASFGSVVHHAMQNGYKPKVIETPTPVKPPPPEKSNGKPAKKDPVEEQLQKIQIQSFYELGEKEYEPIDWVVEEILPKGLTIFAGPAKSGKSFLCLNVALAVAQGGLALSSFNVPSAKSCLYMALDDTERRVGSRLSRILTDSSLPDNAYFMDRMPYLMAGNNLKLYERIIKDYGIELLIIDTMKYILPNGGLLKGTQYEIDYEMIGPVRDFAHDMSLSLLFVTHTRKSKDVDNIWNEIQGSTGVQSAADTMWMLEKKPEGYNFHITGREMPENSFPVKMGKDFIWTASTEQDRIEENSSDTRKLIFDLLDKAGSNGLPYGEIKRKAEQAGVNNGISTLLGKMRDAGEIKQPVARKNYFHPLHVIDINDGVGF